MKIEASASVAEKLSEIPRIAELKLTISVFVSIFALKPPFTIERKRSRLNGLGALSIGGVVRFFILQQNYIKFTKLMVKIFIYSGKIFAKRRKNSYFRFCLEIKQLI